MDGETLVSMSCCKMDFAIGWSQKTKQLSTELAKQWLSKNWLPLRKLEMAFH